MVTATRTAARRLRIDPRLVLGIALVAGSTAGVVALVDRADATVAVYAARDTLLPGDAVTSDDLALTEVRVEGGEAAYVAEGDLPDGALVTAVVRAGELLPAATITGEADDALAPVVLAVGGELSEAVAPGASVDVWAAREGDDGRYGAPAVLVPDAVVVRRLETEGLGSQAGGEVELLVERDRVARVLEAIANADSLAVVPAGAGD